MKTISRGAAIAAAFLTSSALLAQNKGLLYTPLAPETTNQCAMPLISNLNPNEIQHVVPAAAPVSAAFAPRQGHEVMIGEHDLDGSWHDPALFSGFDALLPPVDQAGVPLLPDARNVWFSPQALTPVLAGAVDLHPAELGRLLPGCVLERFITRAQLFAAFGIPMGTAGVNLDAAALCLPQALFLSFENAVNIATAQGMFAVQDGDIVAIPAGAIAFGLSPYDGAIVVNGVAAGSGLLVLTEAQVDARVAASGIRNAAGALVPTVGDLDGLEFEPAGGTFYSQLVEQWLNGGQVCNLIFCGSNLTGAGIASTLGGGQIAVINGVPMNGVSGGTHVGLLAPAGSLNGLGLTTGGLIRFATECTGQMLGAGVLHIEMAAEAGGVAVLLLRFPAAVGVGGCDPSMAWANLAFPDYYLAPVVLPAVAGGCTAYNIPIGAAIWPVVVNTRMLFQGAHALAAGGLALSTPSSVQFY